jgi:hypothetical protein
MHDSGSNPTRRGEAADRRALDRPRHPTGQAAVLLVVVTVAIVGLATLSAWGLI